MMVSLQKAVGAALAAVAVGLALVLAQPLRAEDAIAPEVAWQSSITGQVQAFRDKDAIEALSYAALGFRVTFADPRQFFITIISTGYAPIMESVSHSFGRFEMAPNGTVLQVVKFIGPKQEIYEAIYQMGEEAEGWRVLAVQLVKTPGIGV